MKEIIERMKSHGWARVDGYVQHPKFGRFESWIHAIITCIDVACE